MYFTIILLMLNATIFQLGMSAKDFLSCKDRKCAYEIERKSRELLKVDWKPISVFHEEAERFRPRLNGRESSFEKSYKHRPKDLFRH